LNALRKNQLLRFYEVLQSAVQHCDSAIAKAKKATKYRDYCKLMRRYYDVYMHTCIQ
jgi:hypothetical protein